MRLFLCAAALARLNRTDFKVRIYARRGARISTPRLDDADALEIRLDVTVLWCQCLARELEPRARHEPAEGGARVHGRGPAGAGLLRRVGVLPLGALGGGGPRRRGNSSPRTRTARVFVVYCSRRRRRDRCGFSSRARCTCRPRTTRPSPTTRRRSSGSRRRWRSCGPCDDIATSSKSAVLEFYSGTALDS